MINGANPQRGGLGKKVPGYNHRVKGNTCKALLSLTEWYRRRPTSPPPKKMLLLIFGVEGFSQDPKPSPNPIVSECTHPYFAHRSQKEEKHFLPQNIFLL